MTISGVPGYSNPYSTQATGVAQAGAARPTDGDDDTRVRQHHHHEDGGDDNRGGGMLGFMDSIFKALGQLGLVPGADSTSGSTTTSAAAATSSTASTTAGNTTGGSTSTDASSSEIGRAVV